MIEFLLLGISVVIFAYSLVKYTKADDEEGRHAWVTGMIAWACLVVEDLKRIIS